MKFHTVNFNIIFFIKPYIFIIQGLLVIPVSWFLMDRVLEGCISKQLDTYSHSHFLQTLEPPLTTAAQNQCHCFSPFEKGNMQKHCINPKKLKLPNTPHLQKDRDWSLLYLGASAGKGFKNPMLATSTTWSHPAIFYTYVACVMHLRKRKEVTLIVRLCLPSWICLFVCFFDLCWYSFASSLLGFILPKMFSVSLASKKLPSPNLVEYDILFIF